ncbi:MAG TPA: bifunctional pyr operon transcriptional regulator/uracil phosphoribosyltransferase PyrR [Candidatus Limnocylindrales bacterium]|nr:bifunctional pyr operon transcriptional regulator/uracil phosphoribosyltransferase PyrR [Candidatus Limnocylindrales bacterium]
MMQTSSAKAIVLDAEGVRRAWRRIAHEVVERQHELDRLAIVGIVTRGVPLAERLADSLATIAGRRPPVYALDVRAYRDDQPREVSAPPAIPREVVHDRPVLLVDDVLFNGRTVRAAVEAVMAAGRPTAIQLAVLVDRGHRELPIRPDYVGKNVPTSLREWIEVRVAEVDGEDCVRILEREGH